MTRTKNPFLIKRIEAQKVVESQKFQFKRSRCVDLDKTVDVDGDLGGEIDALSNHESEEEDTKDSISDKEMSENEDTAKLELKDSPRKKVKLEQSDKILSKISIISTDCLDWLSIDSKTIHGAIHSFNLDLDSHQLVNVSLFLD